MKSNRILLFIGTVLLLFAGACQVIKTHNIRLGTLTLRVPATGVPDTGTIDPEQLLAQGRYNDTLDNYRQWLDSSRCRFWFPKDDSTFFDPLFAAMEQAAPSGRHLRVLHYGDSQIEMDRISDRLRARLQRQFGGGGPGMVPVNTIIPSPAISQWGSESLVRMDPYSADSTVMRSRGNYGPMIQCFRMYEGATATFRLGRNKYSDSLIHQCSHIGLLRHEHSATEARLTVQGKHHGTLTASRSQSADGKVVLQTWQSDSAFSRFSLSIHGNADIYGVLVDDAAGVAVDNIPMRGCSGQQFILVDSILLADAYALLDVGMIILQFGGNSVPYIRHRDKLDTYCHGLAQQIDRLHGCCPQATILFIGPSDMSTRIGGVTQTYPYLDSIICGLRDTITAHDAAFWSPYHAMGGKNSMQAWNKKGLAGSDYIHFTQQGADLAGDMLSEAFMTMYRYYRFRKNNNPCR